MNDNVKNIRGMIFWGMDRLRSQAIRNHYNDIKFHYYNSTSQQSLKIREGYLKNLLEHVSLSVPYYKNYHGIHELQDFPVINKLSVINNYDLFTSDLHARRDMIAITTSGSTGTPFTIYKDKNKVLRHQAENIFYSEIANYHLGSKLYYTRVWNNVNKKSFVERIKTNIVPVDISNLSNENLCAFLEKITRERYPISILGFASFFEALARYIDGNDFAIANSYKVNSIITISEALPNHARMILQHFFKCSIFSRYSNMENGFIGQQDGTNDDRYLLNHGSMHVEILDLSTDTPVAFGRVGRIVVTDYFNYGMPLVRYDTGDLGILEVDNKFGNFLSKVEGRRTDFIYNTRGELLSPHVITNTMWNFKDLAQFQFLQLDKGKYKVKLNYKGGSYPHKDFLISSLTSFLGDEAVIELEYVEEIPLLSSGKRSKVVNLMPR